MPMNRVYETSRETVRTYRTHRVKNRAINVTQYKIHAISIDVTFRYIHAISIDVTHVFRPMTLLKKESIQNTNLQQEI